MIIPPPPHGCNTTVAFGSKRNDCMRVAHRVFARGRFKTICECCCFVSRHPAGVEAVQLKLDHLTHLSSIQRLNNIGSPSTHSAVRA